MNRITIEEIRKATEGQLVYGRAEDEISGVCIDSRKIEEGQLFVPIIGTVNDAHKFIPQVYEKGCRTFFSSHEELCHDYKDCNVILVEDTTAALQNLAKYYLEKLNLKSKKKYYNF